MIGHLLFANIHKKYRSYMPRQRYVSRLSPEQQRILQQQQAAIAGKGAGGAYGQSADYYRSILENDPEAFRAFEAPEMRRFNEQIIPGLSEQFAGMGSGGLSSSSFRNAAVSAGTDLSERLGAIRARLRDNAAQGLMGLGSEGLGDYGDVVDDQADWGSYFNPFAKAFGSALGGPLGGNAAGGLSSAFSNWFGGGGAKSSPGIGGGGGRLSRSRPGAY